MYSLVKQEVAMNKYQKEKASYMEQINLAKQKQEEYRNYSEYINSEEYIEKIAREKLGMLLPEERIYIEI
jgi:cell division protein DivIC